MLWHGDISFDGVASFIFGDLIILPILYTYRKYYGARTTVFMFVTFHTALVTAALVFVGQAGLEAGDEQGALKLTPACSVQTRTDPNGPGSARTDKDLFLPQIEVGSSVMSERRGFRIIEHPPHEGGHLRAVHEVDYDGHGNLIGFTGIPVEIVWSVEEGDEAGLRMLEQLREAFSLPVSPADSRPFSLRGAIAAG